MFLWTGSSAATPATSGKLHSHFERTSFADKPYHLPGDPIKVDIERLTGASK